MCVPYVHIRECKKDTDSTLLGNGRLGKLALEIARYDEENECRFEVQREKTLHATRPTWPTAVREMLLELFCD